MKSGVYLAMGTFLENVKECEFLLAFACLELKEFRFSTRWWCQVAERKGIHYKLKCVLNINIFSGIMILFQNTQKQTNEFPKH